MRSWGRTAVPAAALWALPFVVAVEIANVLRPRLMWVHWVTTIDVVNGAYVLLVPLIAGTSCVATVQVRRDWEMCRTLPDAGMRALLEPVLGTFVVFAAAPS